MRKIVCLITVLLLGICVTPLQAEKPSETPIEQKISIQKNALTTLLEAMERAIEGNKHLVEYSVDEFVESQTNSVLKSCRASANGLDGREEKALFWDEIEKFYQTGLSKLSETDPNRAACLKWYGFAIERIHQEKAGL